MVAEPQVQNTIIGVLANDTPLIAPSGPFIGFLNRWPKKGSVQQLAPGVWRETIPGATSWVWGQPGETDYGRMRNVGFVSHGGEPPAPGRAAPAIGGFAGFPVIHGIAHAGDDGKAALALLGARIGFHFSRRHYPLNDGGGVELTRLEMADRGDADEFGYPGMILWTWRVQAMYLRPEMAR